MNLQKRILQIKKELFYSNPLLFSVASLHNFIPNSALLIAFRSGNFCIEYNPSLCEELSDQDLKDSIKIELFRLLLQHPYSRKPLNVKAGVLFLASDITIYQNLNINNNSLINNSDLLKGVQFFKQMANTFKVHQNPLGKMWENTPELKFFRRNLNLDYKTGKLLLVDKLTFEQWYNKILFLIENTSIAGSVLAGESDSSMLEQCGQASELWEDNEQAQKEIKNQITQAQLSNNLEGFSGGESRIIKDSVDFSFDYRKALTQFRQSIVTASRTLTRMKPSRRYGFSAMGSRYERKAQILIAVDVSGSISDESFNNFCHAIKNFFYLKIIEKIDLIFFDVNLIYTKPITFNKKVDFNAISGRGGTNFQIPFDYYNEHKSFYNGMIIFTDGEGNIPVTFGHSNILWILDSYESYSKNNTWINALNNNKCTYLPF